MFVRPTIVAFPGVLEQWQQIVVFVSIASMALGSFAAIGQRNFKRLMAYSSIGHMGFALIGLAAGTEEGVRGVVVYMTIYLAMTLGTFACILAMRYQEGSVEELADLAGLARTHPGMALFLALLLFSLAGVPPLAGFFAKFYVFLAGIKAGQQTAGRGGRNRAFISERGNLSASLLLTDPSPADRAAELSFVAALALGDAVSDVAAVVAPRLRFKWPNDLLCDGGKLAG